MLEINVENLINGRIRVYAPGLQPKTFATMPQALAEVARLTAIFARRGVRVIDQTA